jgi:16S rRNA (adenine1518-N6/adenine1519-N6)-dimethyltransferase
MSKIVSSKVKPKKHLGQHFLIDHGIALDIVEAVTVHGNYETLLEIGAGTGVLSQYLLTSTKFKAELIDIDKESIAYLHQEYPKEKDRIRYADFLQMDIEKEYPKPIGIIGNFPYNISSQIFFQILENPDHVLEVVCMLQKEVALRIASPPGNRVCGILSIFLQAFYDIEYLFTVNEHVFDPPPKVKSGVIRLRRNTRKELPCQLKNFKLIVKQAFSTRRKTLRNSFKPLALPDEMIDAKILDKRAEELTVEDFIAITLSFEALGR